MLAIDYKILQPISSQNFEQISDGDVQPDGKHSITDPADSYDCMQAVLTANG